MALENQMAHIQAFCACQFHRFWEKLNYRRRDLKCMTKIVNGILILRKTNSSAWPSDMDNGMNNWVTQYITWLETAKIALEEQSSTK